jgi:predicted porin
MRHLTYWSDDVKHTTNLERPAKPMDRSKPRYRCGLVLLGAVCASGGAFAESIVPDETLTWHGITLYGLVDIGLQYDDHGAPFSDYHPAGSSNIVQKDSRQSVFGATPSNLSQSRIGLKGVEPLVGDWQAVFKLETFFNPQSGDISDAQKSQVLNNGVAAGSQTTNLNSSVAGQAFQTAYAGVSSATFGTLTFGRQLTPLADAMSRADPNASSQAFSLIGMSGTYMGGGDTEDKRLDSSLKYTATFAEMVRVSALFKFNGSNGASNTARQIDVGGDFAGASVDAVFSKVNDAISNAPLSSSQVTDLPTQPETVGLPMGAFSVSNSLAGTISDNTAYGLMGTYTISVLKFFLGYEHIQYANPTHPLNPGFTDIGGYNEAYTNNAAYDVDKVLQVYWAGAKYTVIPKLDLTLAYYGYHQNAYGTGADAGCTTNAHGSCSGYFEAFSLDAVYAINKRFDVYAGAMYSAVYNGVANGYDYQRNNINPTVGVRFTF